MTEEDKISRALTTSLQERNHYSTIEIGHRKEVLIGSTCGVYKSDLGLLFQSAEQDIVVFLKDEEEQYVFEGKNFFKRFPRSLADNKILVPLVIFEVKYKGVNTHTVRQYSELARMIKTIFPFCLYNFLLINTTKTQAQYADRIYMAAKSFDKIIYKADYAIGNRVHNELIETIWGIIQAHITYLQEEKYFRLISFLT